MRGNDAAIPTVLALLTLLLAFPEPALAAGTASLNVSLSQGILIKPKPTGAADTSALMVGVGLQILDSLRFELAMAMALRARQQGAFDLQVRPSFVLDADGWPAYVRVTGAVVQIIQGPIGGAFGAGVGASYHFSKEPLVVFAEVGFLGHADKMRSGKTKMHWILEARLGAAFEF